MAIVSSATDDGKTTPAALTPNLEIDVAKITGLENVRSRDLRHASARFTVTAGS